MTDDELKALTTLFNERNETANAAIRRHFEETAGALVGETRRHFDISVEAVRHDVRLVAEAVSGMQERLTNEITRLDQDLDRGFAETQAMIRFSHAELEGRVRKLEEGLAELKSRVERLESAPQRSRSVPHSESGMTAAVDVGHDNSAEVRRSTQPHVRPTSLV